MVSAPPKTEVIVCVHNSPQDVELCLKSLRDTLRAQDRAIVVDDGSDDETRIICEEITSSCADKFTLIRRSEGSGFCRAANAGLRASRADMVILLNSDTIVCGDWIARMEACMQANWQIGIVGPLSNAGGWQSVPQLPTKERPANPISADAASLLKFHRYASVYKQNFPYPLVEQINGFCMGLSREVIEKVGYFDEVAFPMGYGEESDLTFRALDAGFLCAVATDCFVYHAKTKSYSSEDKEKFNQSGQVQLKARHGVERVQIAVKNTHQNPILAAIREDAADYFRRQGW